MGYQPFLIANYATGINDRLQPWLIPDDAQEELYDGYVYRGVMSKRDGYNYFAIGQRSSQPYCESRIVDRVSAEPARTSGGVLVQGDGTPGPYTFRIQNLPVRRGTVVVSAGIQSANDNGLGGFLVIPSGTINYTTGDVTLTFTNNVAAATQLYILYDYHPGLPVMGIMNFVSSTDTKQLIVADTKRLNLYNSTTNTLNYLGATYSINAITQANPGQVTTTANHNLTTGDRIFITGVLGMNQVNNTEYTITKVSATQFTIGVDTTAYTAYSSAGTVELIYSGANHNFWSWVNYPDAAGNPRLLYTNNKDEIGYYAPNLTGPSVTMGNYINYPITAAVQFYMDDDGGSPVTSITCLQLFSFKDRLIMLRTTESGIIKPYRIRISGTGASSDDFRTSATGAGFIDIPSGSWIQGATFNRDDLIIFTETSTWVLSYTGNDTTPFTIKKIDESRGSQAPFSAFTYLNRSSAASTRGLIITDGYRVERQDELIPDFSFNEVDGENFRLCFAGVVDADRDHYLIYPTTNSSKSTRILTTNYEEDNYSIYRLSLSCMGTYVNAFDIDWTDLAKFNNWNEFGASYGNWNSFAYTAGSPFSVGGGHYGEIWRLNATESEDNPVKVRNITIIDAQTIEVTTDWNNFSVNTLDRYMGADYIFLTGISGMVEVNNKQYPIKSVTNNYTFRLTVPNSSAFSAFTTTSIGEAQRVIPFDALFKKFNPYANMDKKVRCGWLYMYVNSSDSRLTRNIPIGGASKADPCVITTLESHNLNTGDLVTIFSVGGMTELNNLQFYITVLSTTTFSLNGIDSTGYTAYTSGGYIAVQESAKAEIQIYVNDVNHKTTLDNPNQSPYQGTITNLAFEDGSKKWYKIFVNQTGRFIQFRIKNVQAGAKVNIQATMPGFQPVGRLL